METSGQERCPARAWGIVRSASYPPAVRWLRPSSEDEMVAPSLRTELASVRHGSRIRPCGCPLPLDAGVDRQALACGQLRVAGRRVDASVAELLLHLAQRDALPDLQVPGYA